MACKATIGSYIKSKFSGLWLGPILTDDPADYIPFLNDDPANTGTTYHYAGDCKIGSDNLELPIEFKTTVPYEITFKDDDTDAGTYCVANLLVFPTVMEYAVGQLINTTAAPLLVRYETEAEFFADLATLNITATRKDGECAYTSFELTQDEVIEIEPSLYIYDTCCIEENAKLTSIISGVPYLSDAGCKMPLTGLTNPFGSITFASSQSTAAGIANELNVQEHGGADKVWGVTEDCKISLSQIATLDVPDPMTACQYKRWKVQVRMYWANSGSGLNSWKDSQVMNQQTFGPPLLGTDVHYYNGMYHTGGSLWDNSSIGDMFRNVYAKGDTGVSGADNRGNNNIGGHKVETLEAWEYWKQQLVEHCQYGLTTQGICGVVGIVDDQTFVNLNNGAQTRHYAYLYYDLPCNIVMEDTSFNDLSASDAAASYANEWDFNVGNPAEPQLTVENWTKDNIQLINHFKDFQEIADIGTFEINPSYGSIVGTKSFEDDCTHASIGEPTDEGGIEEHDG